MVKYVKGRYAPCLGIVERYDSHAFIFASNPKSVLSYYYFGGIGTIFWGKGGKHEELIIQQTQVPWKIGETVKMKVDLINWQIMFYKKGIQFGRALRIKERDVYYAAVQIFGEKTLEIVD